MHSTLHHLCPWELWTQTKYKFPLERVLVLHGCAGDSSILYGVTHDLEGGCFLCLGAAFSLWEGEIEEGLTFHCCMQLWAHEDIRPQACGYLWSSLENEAPSRLALLTKDPLECSWKNSQIWGRKCSLLKPLVFINCVKIPVTHRKLHTTSSVVVKRLMLSRTTTCIR